MKASIVLGWILVTLGILAITIGLAMGVLIYVLHAIRGSKKELVESPKLEFAKVLADLLKEMLKHPGGIFFVVGFLLLAAGIALLMFTPF